MRKYTVEVIGTFFLVLTIGLAAGAGLAGALAPLAIASVLIVMIYAGGHISGAHYNPAATLAIWLRGACPVRDVPGYVVAQLIGAVLAITCVGYLVPEGPFTMATYGTSTLLLAEFLFTFALCWVILNVATAKATAGNTYFGLAIGLTVCAGAFAVGPVSSAVFNPAVAVALCVIGILPWASLWIYIVAQLAGAALAALAFKMLVREE